MIDLHFASHFATEWIESWNSHDLDRIMTHYDNELEFSGPFVTRITGEPSGVLNGKERVKEYWKKALQLVPDLRFELVTTLVGIDSIVIYYKNQKGQLNAEVFCFDSNKLVRKSRAHAAI